MLGLATPAADVTFPTDEILRFRASERRLHWSIAIPFIICYVTAVVLVLVYNLHPERPFHTVVSWIHRIAAVCLILLPPWTVLRHRHDLKLYWYNVRQVFRWTLDDLKWLVLIGPATVSRRITLPHQGKFNAGEKVNFVTLIATYPIFIVTGLLIWFTRGSMVAWLVHFAAALTCTPLMLGHLYMATINPDTRVGLAGMFSGSVDRRWARHHYRLWYEEHFGTTGPAVAMAEIQPNRPDPALGEFERLLDAIQNARQVRTSETDRPRRTSTAPRQVHAVRPFPRSCVSFELRCAFSVPYHRHRSCNPTLRQSTSAHENRQETACLRPVFDPPVVL